jgi:hypothetical protein
MPPVPNESNFWHANNSANAAVTEPLMRRPSLKRMVSESKKTVRVLGIDLSHLPSAQQFTLMAGLCIAFNLIYGCLQEYLVLHVFQRRLGLFMSLIQTSSFALCAHLHRLQLGEAHSRRIPRRWYMLLALCQSSAMALGNVGMMHLNYAAKVLFKSTKVSTRTQS